VISGDLNVSLIFFLDPSTPTVVKVTLLVKSTASGLKLLTRDGKWMPVKAKKGQILVDTKDMLSRISNEVIPAITAGDFLFQRLVGIGLIKK
jgi:hypothetical protein